MIVRATQINPEMLRWARERSGYTIDDIARRRRVSPERVLQWEAGKSFPTWRQLEQLAYLDYHRGTVFFFLNNPPDEKRVADEFPSLPSAMLTDLYPDTMYAVRQARIRQEDLAELLGPDGVAERLILRDLPVPADAVAPVKLAAAVRQYLGGTADELEIGHRNDVEFSEWRQMIEDAGVWVFKRSFRQKDVAGFCLGDAAYPVIYLNHGQDKARQIFTLFNQLAHLLLGFNHLERGDKRHYRAELPPDDRSIEDACLKFAKELAGHTSNAATYYLDGPTAYSAATDLDTVRVSGGYYDFQQAFLGRKYLRAAFTAFDDGRIDDLELASYLGVRGIYLDKLEGYAWQP